MRLRPPRTGYSLAWGGDLGDLEPGRCTDREFAPALDVLEAVESSPSTRLSPRGEWTPITSDLLTRVRDGLQEQ